MSSMVGRFTFAFFGAVAVVGSMRRISMRVGCETCAPAARKLAPPGGSEPASKRPRPRPTDLDSPPTAGNLASPMRTHAFAYRWFSYFGTQTGGRGRVRG